MADEIKLNQEQFNSIITKLDSIDRTLDALYKTYKDYEKSKEALETFKVGYQINKEFIIDNYLMSNDPEIDRYLPLAVAKGIVQEFPVSNDNDSSNNSNNAKLDELIKEISNSSKDDRTSFNMLVNTLKDSNSKQELKELKALTVSTNELLVKQVNAQNQFNSGCFVFAILVISAAVFKFSKNLFSGLF